MCFFSIAAKSSIRGLAHQTPAVRLLDGDAEREDGGRSLRSPGLPRLPGLGGLHQTGERGGHGAHPPHV